tara:strand:- start:49141 stop:49290 length:150 start_codon:yes stop_codon:yes gene_type:complete
MATAKGTAAIRAYRDWRASDFERVIGFLFRGLLEGTIVFHDLHIAGPEK